MNQFYPYFAIIFFGFIFVTTCTTNQVVVMSGTSNSDSTTQKTKSINISSARHKDTTESLSSIEKAKQDSTIHPIKVGAERLNLYLNKIRNKKIALVVNQTSMVKNQHLVDVLLEKNINIKKIFAPEHGFRGKSDAGEHVANGKDMKTNIPLISLYGKHKKPKASDLTDIEIVLFDIQDVGVRFYTYISTMHYVMEACAENHKKCIILDRPNPNGSYIDGKIREEKYKSFVGMHPIPIVHGLTIGELALMIKGEKWLKGEKTVDLEVIKCQNYTHQTPYQLPVRPSPNLPNPRAVSLYPTLCLFEGTKVSVGRGTDFPFQVAGTPHYPQKDFYFTPSSREGAKNPKYKNVTCYGMDFRKKDNFQYQFSLQPIIEFYQKSNDKQRFFKNYLSLLYGSDQLQKDVEKGKTEEEIRATWQTSLKEYKIMRQKYLLYQE